MRRAAFVLAILSACAPAPRGLLVLTVDSLRPDHLGAYGYGARATSPHLDALARDATVYEQVFAPAASTSPSLVSLFTGLWPPAHGVETRGQVLARGTRTLVHALAEQGYRGFGYRHDGDNYAGLGFAPLVERDPLATLRAHGHERFFVWHHLKQAHLPYQPRGRFAQSAPPAPVPDWWRLVTSQDRLARGSVVWPDGVGPALAALYDEGVAAADAEIGRILAGLDALGLGRDTVVVVTADHGEELLERGHVGHASTTFDTAPYVEVVRVPLLVRSGRGARREPGLFSLLDALPLAMGAAPARERVYASGWSCGWMCEGRDPRYWLALRDQRWTLLLDRERGERRLYDRRADPGERDDLASAQPERAAALADQLLRWHRAEKGVNP